MFGSLPELFGRNFAVGYLLPALVFAGFSLLLADCYGVLTVAQLLDFYTRYTVLATVLGPVLLWLGAVSLLAINNQIIRTKEGYFLKRLFPGWILNRQKCRIAELRHQIYAGKGRTPEARRKMVTQFPVREEEIAPAANVDPQDGLLLPTTFGNIIRAFELYPGEMYGFEATRGWSRLIGVIPKDYRDVIESAKAELDFLINLWVLSGIFLAEYLAFAWWEDRFASWLFPLGAGLSLLVASRLCLGAATRWGETVKGAFDIFLPDLRLQLCLKAPRNRDQEWEMWRRFSEAFLTRNRETLPELEAGQPPKPGSKAA